MRLALRIAYDGRPFYGHQRQPDARTVEGECIAALKSARILQDPQEAFFRSASRTDRGVSAVGNVIAFDSSLKPDGALGAFNDRARDVWAWAVAEVPEGFHPRHARERWYRYHLYDDYSVPALGEAASLFVGEHPMRSFTSDPPATPMPVHRVDVARDDDAIVVDVRAPSFRRGMVRRIVSALAGHARGEIDLPEIRTALQGERRDFGTVPPEPLFLMEVSYDFPFRTLLKPKVLEEWRKLSMDAALRTRLLRAARAAASRDTT